MHLLFLPPRVWAVLSLLLLLPASGRVAAQDEGGPAPAVEASAEPAAATHLDREPELERDEVRRLAPGESVTELNLDPILLPPSAARRRQAGLREALSPTPEMDAQLRIRALEGFLDYDEQDQMIYSPGRTRIVYKQYTLEADKLILDSRLREVQAEGNVIMQIGEGTITADSMRYNFDAGEGVAYNVSGESAPVYFRAADPTKEQLERRLPQFQKVSREETLFRNTKVSTCDFKVPHYYVRGREVVLFEKDRIFFRGATFHVWGMPVMYLPVYTRSLAESSPWGLALGYSSRTGARVRLSYSFMHATEEPSLTDDKKIETRSRGFADVYVDYLSEVGFGTGFDYDYVFEFGKHRGLLSIYGLRDEGREVVSPRESDDPFNRSDINDDSSDRYAALWKHRSKITEDLILQANVDWFSDPDIFYDVLDNFAADAEQRNRQVVRRARGSLTFTQEAYVARLMGEIKDRIGLDRYTEYANPRDDNRDFDLQPYGDLEDNDDVDGLSSKRWGRVSERAPQLDIATRWLPIGMRPWYYTSELHLYNNLDKGFNTVNGEDDAFVRGAEFYNRLLRQFKLSPRYTLITALGVGIGAADREEDKGFVLDDARLNSLEPSSKYPATLDGLEFVNSKDGGTFLVGKREMNYEQLTTSYGWADAEAKLNARFSDALTGYLRWRARETTQDFVGDWYARTGDVTYREDLYDYKIREHWIEGNLNYRLARPILNLFTNVGYNLEPKTDRFSKEEISYAYAGYSWANQRQTLTNSGRIGMRQRQTFDPSDPDQYVEDKVFGQEEVTYKPIHRRWYAKVAAGYEQSLNGNVERDSDSRRTFFSDEDPDTYFRTTYGRELGPKWNTELRAEWDQQVGGLREVSWLLERDLHDATAMVRVSVENDEEDTDDRNEAANSNQMDVRFGINVKLPENEVAFGAARTSTASQPARAPALAF